ncbi:hypothetical protein [Rhizosaccharibacter radicis]|uniref:DUF429 domain-containing protein n=1 Tax=Rhizosaccharibacter radicis TaxID=2782605 RepID=A0ABT1W037_9PROT|nr:DUF429 domain-containing protein [Acetobacteraceae bacterium KSS12]
MGDLSGFVMALKRFSGPVLAGFDFPIGVPRFYGERTGLPDFRALLAAAGTGRWSRFFDVAVGPNEIGLERPFYPMRPGGTGRVQLLQGLGATAMDQLMRRCERRTADRPAGCCLFWTLGGNQVGKAALAGWREAIRPLLEAGAALWPFDGALEELSTPGGVVLAETYPAEAYRHVGISPGPLRSKREVAHRREAMAGLRTRCAGHGIHLTPALEREVANGFADAGTRGEDAFDALAGLLGMIEVADGRRAPGPRDPDPWEGWILGQSAG